MAAQWTMWGHITYSNPNKSSNESENKQRVCKHWKGRHGFAVSA